MDVEDGAAEGGEGLGASEGVCSVGAGGGQEGEVGGWVWWVRGVGCVEGEAAFEGDVGEGYVAFCDGLEGVVVLLGEGEVQVGYARADLDVSNGEGCGSDCGTPREFEVEVDGVRGGAFRVR